MATRVLPPVERLPGTAGDGTRTGSGDTLPIDVSKLSEKDRAWVLTAYNERTEATRLLAEERARLEQERTRFNEELQSRERLIVDLSKRPTPTEPNPRDERGPVPREFTPEYTGPRETDRIDYDPWDPNGTVKLAAAVRRIAIEEAERMAKAQAKWYAEDREKLWTATTQQDGLGVLYAAEWSELMRTNPDLSVAEFGKIVEAAPRYNYSLRAAYSALHPEKQANQLRASVREEVEKELRPKLEAEFQAKYGAAPPADGQRFPPVLGGPTSHPRSRGAARTATTYGEATRQGYEEMGSKLFE